MNSCTVNIAGTAASSAFLCAFSWPFFGFWTDVDSLLLIGLSVSVSLSLSLSVLWQAANALTRLKLVFRWAEICQSSPCLSDHSFIWSLALVLWPVIFHSFASLVSFSVSFYMLPSCFTMLHKFLFTSNSYISTHTHLLPVRGVAFESCWPLQVNVVERGYVNTSSPFDTPLSLSQGPNHTFGSS